MVEDGLNLVLLRQQLGPGFAPLLAGLFPLLLGHCASHTCRKNKKNQHYSGSNSQKKGIADDFFIPLLEYSIHRSSESIRAFLNESKRSFSFKNFENDEI